MGVFIGNRIQNPKSHKNKVQNPKTEEHGNKMTQAGYKQDTNTMDQQN